MSYVTLHLPAKIAFGAPEDNLRNARIQESSMRIRFPTHTSPPLYSNLAFGNKYDHKTDHPIQSAPNMSRLY